MSKRDARATLFQIAENARVCALSLCREDASRVVVGLKSVLAFERALEIVGEAVKRLPTELCDAYPAVPWRTVAGMRDRLSHGYDEVDYEILWNAVHEDLPNLLRTVNQMIREIEKTN